MLGLFLGSIWCPPAAPGSPVLGLNSSYKRWRIYSYYFLTWVLGFAWISMSQMTISKPINKPRKMKYSDWPSLSLTCTLGASCEMNLLGTWTKGGSFQKIVDYWQKSAVNNADKQMQQLSPIHSLLSTSTSGPTKWFVGLSSQWKLGIHAWKAEKKSAINGTKI